MMNHLIVVLNELSVDKVWSFGSNFYIFFIFVFSYMWKLYLGCIHTAGESNSNGISSQIDQNQVQNERQQY